MSQPRPEETAADRQPALFGPWTIGRDLGIAAASWARLEDKVVAEAGEAMNKIATNSASVVLTGSARVPKFCHYFDARPRS